MSNHDWKMIDVLVKKYISFMTKTFFLFGPFLTADDI